MQLKLWVLLIANALVLIDGFNISKQSFGIRLDYYRIQSGEVVNPKDWPYIASIVQGIIVICSGSLISTKWVLTAARCFQEQYLSFRKEFHLKLGAAFGVVGHSTIFIPRLLNTTGPWTATETNEKLYYDTVPRTKIIPVRRLFLHSAYLNVTNKIEVNKNDIALLQLRRSPSVEPFSFPKYGARYGYDCKVHGWGPREILSAASIFQQIKVRVFSPEEAELKLNFISETVLNNLLHKKLLTKSETARARLGSTDMGSPLICENEIKGIASMTIQVCTSNVTDHVEINYPVFTRIDRYISWINRVMRVNREPLFPRLKSNEDVYDEEERDTI